MESRGGRQSLKKLELQAVESDLTWMLETEPEVHVRTGHALNH